ncbi:hypothetical protein AYI70_g6835 [Smittium culicis]|uniref:Expansin-like EG45 domain-containing protein n=1 Tax=Smittium culicis TaxID=133412 RepID=A0A1R1XN63_9FUNG|nr:hypothetical protein AYI70_g6835 [Smittium culicis]
MFRSIIIKIVAFICILFTVNSQDTLYGGAPMRVPVRTYPNRGYSGASTIYQMVPNACMVCPTFNSMQVVSNRFGVIRIFSKKDCTGSFYDFNVALVNFVDIYSLTAFVPKTWVFLPDLY